VSFNESTDALPLIETRLSVLTWNVWWRFGPWEARQPAITETLRGIGADVIALQEVWDTGDGAGQPGALAGALGYHHAYAPCFDAGEACFGNAVLSRWPIAAMEARALPTTPTTNEFRVALRAEIEGPRGRFEIYTTHLNWRYDESHVRQSQVRALAEFVAESRERAYPPILCGDFNAEPISEEIRMLTGRNTVPVPRLVFIDAWDVAGHGPGFTWCNDNPYAAADLEADRRIDYVLVGWRREGGAGHVVGASVEGIDAVDGVYPSDHYAVLAELRY
jgi:endonuclease/exonuclease/phosphatase family metal-dependent hydrolase